MRVACAIEIPVCAGGCWPSAEPPHLSPLSLLGREMQLQWEVPSSAGETLTLWMVPQFPQPTGEGSVVPTFGGRLGEGLNPAVL